MITYRQEEERGSGQAALTSTLSTSTFTKMTLSNCSLSVAKKGPIIWHGPHQVALKSTITCSVMTPRLRRVPRPLHPIEPKERCTYRLALSLGISKDAVPVRLIVDLNDLATSHRVRSWRVG